MINIAVFASHSGSDLQAAIDGCAAGLIDGRICAVISNNADAYALTRADNAGIDRYCLRPSDFETEGEYDGAVLRILKEHETDMIFLAGYLKKIGAAVISAYKNRIFNIHPALLPKYGGKGMYGIKVHTAVIEAGEKETGVTIHRVSCEYDSGEIVAQTRVPEIGRAHV